MPVAIREFEVLPESAPASGAPAAPAATPRPPGDAERREELRRALVRLATRLARTGDR
jgi:hypothetical protein